MRRPAMSVTCWHDRGMTEGAPEPLAGVTVDTGAAPAHATGSVGLLQGSALYIAAVLGTGILVLPALAATSGRAGIHPLGARGAAAVDPARRHLRRARRTLPRLRRRRDLRAARARQDGGADGRLLVLLRRLRSALPSSPCSAAYLCRGDLRRTAMGGRARIRPASHSAASCPTPTGCGSPAGCSCC